MQKSLKVPKRQINKHTNENFDFSSTVEAKTNIFSNRLHPNSFAGNKTVRNPELVAWSESGSKSAWMSAHLREPF